MIEIQKLKKNNIFLGSFIFVLLTAYCYVVNVSLVFPFVLFTCGLYFILFQKITLRCVRQLSFLLVLLFALAHAMIYYSDFSAYFIPVASMGMLVMLLFGDLELSFVMVFLSSLLVSLMVGMQISYMIPMFLGGIVGAYIVRDAHTRGVVLLAGVMIGVVQALGYFLMHPIVSKEILFDYLRPLLMSGLLSTAVVLATLKVFEMLFGEMTHFTLMELSDSLHQPLLKRLAIEAPGTYHHVLVVSNLAGSAADAIGAKAFLTRVGAYYHDIGKLAQPEYFTENQIHMNNKHHDIEPSLSRLVIINHIKEGVELAQKEKLNPKIIDFIKQHHGTSVLYFFYQKALEESNDMDEVNEQDYRYPGPKPTTKETALVMLADAVEGASRSIDEYTSVKIEEMVRKVINNKFIDGQLDDCGLTLRDLNKICEVFTRTLTAMYHTRVKYPDMKKK